MLIRSGRNKINCSTDIFGDVIEEEEEMATDHGGHFPVFDPSSEQCNLYSSRVKYYFLAKNITDDTIKKNNLLAYSGPQLMEQIHSLCTPKDPEQVKFSEIMEYLDNFYSPASTLVYARHALLSRKRNKKETVVEFAASLQALATKCGKTAVTADQLLCSAFILGIENTNLQQKLLAEETKKFSELLEMAKVYERISWETTQMKGEKSDQATLSQIAQERGRMQRRDSSTTSHRRFGKNRSESRSRFKATKSTRPCFGCGDFHFRSDCPFRNAECHRCHKIGHIKSVCRASRDQSRGRNPRRTSPTRRPSRRLSTSSSSERSSAINKVSTIPHSEKSKKFWATIFVARHQVQMQIDSGATISVINSKTYKEISRFLHLSLVPAPSLHTYTKEEVQVLGKCSIPVQHHSLRRTKFLEVVVVEDESVNNIMGTSWSDAFPKYFPPVETVNAITRSVNEVTSRYPSLFRPIPGRYSSLKVDIDIDSQAVPKYFKARPLPLALQDKVKKRLEQHVEDGSLVRVSNAKWATPIVPVVNQDGSVRITGDYRLTLNPVTKQVQYPIPLTTDLFAKLSGGIIFSKIDLHSAYLQFQLSPESKHLTTINTTFGLFEYNCMPFGICSASAIFQREMDKLFSGISGVAVFEDDIVCTGKTVHEHNETLNEVLSRLDSVGLTVKESKCRFGVDSVNYLGHIIDKDGLRPIPDRVEAIAAMAPPESVPQLKSLLSMINYYAHFIPRVSTVLAPMHQLFKKNKRWEWSASCQQAFDEVKKMLQSSSVLCHYSPTLPIKVTADSSSYGVGAVLSHVVKGEERPIFFASRTLTPAEHNYSQLDKEALAIIFAVKRFQQYL